MTYDRNEPKQWGGHGPPPRIRTLCMYTYTDQENEVLTTEASVNIG